MEQRQDKETTSQAQVGWDLVQVNERSVGDFANPHSKLLVIPGFCKLLQQDNDK